MIYIYLLSKINIVGKLILDKQKFIEFVSNINDTNKFVSYSQELNEKVFSKLIKRLLKISYSNFVYWNNPSQSFSFFGLGEIFAITQSVKNGQHTSINLHAKFKKNHYHNLNKINFNKAPLFIGAQKFPMPEKTSIWNNFDYYKWFIPKYLFLKDGNRYSVIVNVADANVDLDHYLNDLEKLISPDEENYKHENPKYIRINTDDFSKWNDIVYSCLEKISKKELEKVVPARNIKLELDTDIDIAEITATLEDVYPDCYTFVYHNNNSTFFGATPEKLFKVDKGIIETDALAGSIQRGDSQIADEELGNQLLESEKDINEHNSVRNFLLEKLYPVTIDINYECTPRLRKLSNIQHLWTPIKAKLRDDADVLSLIENLFPTPAVCGYPTKTALKLIGSLENFDRGLYSGVIGWFNLENQGEFAVALRSALLKNNVLHAFAGCGIVEGSHPLSEYNETELKFKPILSLFINETIDQS